MPLAAYQIGYNLIGLVFMVAIGTAAASMVRVGNAVGRRNPTDIARAGWAGVLLIAFLMACFAGPFLGLGMPLANLYTDDPAVLPLAAPLIGICGIILMFDGMQAVLMGALRGVADVWVPPGLQLISWWCITVAHRLRAGLRGRDRRRRPHVGAFWRARSPPASCSRAASSPWPGGRSPAIEEPVSVRCRWFGAPK